MKKAVLFCLLTISLFLVSCEGEKVEKGCCTPFCTETSSDECGEESGYGGEWHAASCLNLDECKIGCCLPFCTELTMAQCTEGQGYGGQWLSGSCDDQSQCELVCCEPKGEEMTKVACEQTKDGQTLPLPCEEKEEEKPAKLSGTIKLEISNKNSCELKNEEAEEGSRDDRDINNNIDIIIVYTLSSKADPEDKNNYLEGTYTYTVSGNSNYETLVQSKETCSYEKDSEMTYIDITNTQTRKEYRVYSGLDDGIARVTISLNEDGSYTFSLPTKIKYTETGKIEQTITELGEEGCSTNEKSLPEQTWTLSAEEFGLSIIELSLPQLSGTKTVDQFPTYFQTEHSCGENDIETVTLTSSLQWS
ncbi:MAG: hypothetical protein ABH824_03340 [Nanoarchaeota archaeon]|nr:hypothetical protein [Nanoarchaeota archaeon]MBU1632050.1 hypothetical protein [Nanoarchaeota archaeon]MBU1875823.1 hypothetical protein [Nanoarchaeota archaeon]